MQDTIPFLLSDVDICVCVYVCMNELYKDGRQR